MKTTASTRATQRGTVLLFGLIAMTILLISAVALVRSFNGTLFNAGNVAFKRDLLNQAERVWPVVRDKMQGSGVLSGAAARNADNIDHNYRASVLPTVSSPAIPEALLVDDATFASIGRAPDIRVEDQDVTIRYVIDRLCSAAGAATATNCALADDGTADDDDAKNLLDASGKGGPGSSESTKQVVYRISIRVTGPRNTQAFYQTTFSL